MSHIRGNTVKSQPSEGRGSPGPHPQKVHCIQNSTYIPATGQLQPTFPAAFPLHLALHQTFNRGLFGWDSSSSPSLLLKIPCIPQAPVHTSLLLCLWLPHCENPLLLFLSVLLVWTSTTTISTYRLACIFSVPALSLDTQAFWGQDPYYLGLPHLNY